MTAKMHHFLRITGLLLVLTMILSGPPLSARAPTTRQEPPGQVVQGSGAFPRLPVIAPGAVHAWSVSTDCPAFLQS